MMIRQMTLHDIEAVQQIAWSSWQHLFGEHLPQKAIYSFIERNYSDLMLEKQLEKTFVLIAEDAEGQAAGYISYTPIDIDGESEITALHILPAHLGKGHEEALLQAALDTLDEAAAVDVYVDANSDELKNFYTSRGFSLVETFAEEFEGVAVETMHYELKMKE